ncbi:MULTISPECIES: methyl-accepting chemotaxis protein [Aliivibrio]|uniref:Methyl-accepting chemotaxis protein n=1 Tax=Aliivibrio finisterrensis TaxID=511998 RepID=A0A4Q5KX11_9GAMM|nr:MULTISPECIES: methyl-accepting chemotaxis protein [Aliivibrio]MDD9177701.1 methyl-accepting chemotaxis protein [Aliivibrio sp. A6]RYU50905.1 methyl-accepting chemotaxis protein [Aliivibrio finisterrensis]RYU51946.1 methyl-accepting chemotaxis protein [Aliivibrio finisterrensis]RYU56847.1 methyl-accepting chemotaxis protein [Aliivibrio finisterrensis]RYU59199.1 methyl-accepting chemotaxis protein [Aliivibrio finisterrensis]
MKVKHILYTLCLVGVMGMVFTLGYAYKITQDSNRLNQAQLDLAELRVNLLNMRRNEKDFMTRLDMKYLNKFEKNAQLFHSNSEAIDKTLDVFGIHLQQQEAIQHELKEYVLVFQNLVNAYKTLGLTEQDGLVGDYQQIRKPLYLQAFQNHDVELLEGILLFDEAIQKGDTIQETNLNSNLSELALYANKVIDQKKILGLAYNEGIKGDARVQSSEVERKFSLLINELDEKVTDYVNYLSWQKYLVSGVLIISLISLSIMLSLVIVRRISSQANVINEIIETNNIALRAKNIGEDEISQIGSSFNSLLDKIQLLVSDSQQKSSGLAHSASEMQVQLEKSLDDFNSQLQHTMRMSAAIHDMSLNVADIANNTEAAAENATVSHRNATEGQLTLQEASKGITHLSSVLSLSQQDITHLSELVDKVGSVVAIIQSIAEQTNLLALNAAIEAARAGEQGRGFAVVADEVRSLATRTQESTEEISGIIDSIQAQTSKVVKNIDQCSQQGKRSADQATKAEDILNQIIIDMSMISNSSTQIASAIEEQNVTTTDVSQTIRELGELTKNNIDSAQRCLLEIQGVAAQSEDMKLQVSQFKID